MARFQGIRGMNDVGPGDSVAWQRIEAAAREVLSAYGYREVRTPIVEPTELFKRSVGDATDIVEKEMYTFEDRGGHSITLRPECTASCVRAAVQHGWLGAGGQRIWQMGPMFRFERPQKGRYRQFHQLDVEALGFAGPDLDAELILASRRLFDVLGVENLALEVNCLGSAEAQASYRETLREWFGARKDQLDEDSERRLDKNPLRILDSKNPAMRELIDAAPKLIDHLDETTAAHFEALRGMLDAAGVEYRVSPRLVRGLDYYTGTVFEWTTTELGAQNAVCGGGRYDNLIADIGGKPAPGIGFAIGLERLVALLQARGGVEPPAPDAYLAAVGQRACREAHRVAEALRGAIDGLALVVDAADGSFKAKLRRADRSGAQLALLIGDAECDNASVQLKPLTSGGEQAEIGEARLAEAVRTALGAGA